MKPSIVYIIDDLNISGAQMHLAHLVKGLRGTGFDNIQVINLAGVGELQQRIIDSGVAVKCFSMRSIREPSFFRDFLKMVLFLRKIKPDIVHTYLDTANVFGVLAAKLAGVSRIMTSRRDLGVFRTRRIEQLIGYLSNRVEKVVCVCQAAASESIRREGLRGDNVVVIHNGIDITPYNRKARKTSGKIVFCNVAVANRKEKGQEELIRAFSIVVMTLPDSSLLLVGDGPLLPALKELAGELNIDKKVKFYGRSNEILSLLRDVDAFVLPSHSEGISNALLEAMAMGVPAVVTDVGGNPDVVEDDLSGVIVAPKDVSSLADGMVRLATDKVKLACFGRAAKRRIEDHFTIESMLNKYKSIYLLNIQ
jgi:glycosyltransferase involved in cell wall biosynthesis